jgi:hypothetical protein
MQTYLQVQGYWLYVSDKDFTPNRLIKVEGKDTATAVARNKKWKQDNKDFLLTDSAALGCIKSKVTGSLIKEIEVLGDANAAWEHLATKFGKPGPIMLFSLWKRAACFSINPNKDIMV